MISILSTPAHMVYPKVSAARDWVSGDFIYNEKRFPESDYSLFENESVVDIFGMFTDEEIIFSWYRKPICYFQEPTRPTSLARGNEMIGWNTSKKKKSKS